MAINSKFLNKKNFIILSVASLLFGIVIIVFLIYIFRDKIYKDVLIATLANNLRNTSINVDRIDRQIINEESVVSSVIEKTQDSVVSIGYIDLRSEDDTNPLGSGVIVSADGIVITNKHVVDDEELSYEIIFQNGDRYDVKEIIRDKVKDLALLKIDAKGLKPITTSEAKLKLGQKAIAVGNSLGFSNTVSSGIISGLEREVEVEGEIVKNLIQTDAAINLGNSGGALLNSNGELIGINTAKSIDGENIGFAIPTSEVLDLVNKYNAGLVNKNTAPAFLGITFEFLNLSTYLKRGYPIGPIITGVVKNSPAAKAGIKSGDIILSIDNVEFSSESELTQFIKSKFAEDKIKIKIYRKGEILEIQATLIEMK